jgi:hypothetical protein
MQLFGPESWGKALLLLGGGILILGLLVFVLERLGLPLGRLPGDIRIEGARGSFYFPIVTCLAVSAIASLLLHLISKR